MVLVDDAATLFAGESHLLGVQKRIHIDFCIIPVLDDVYPIVLDISFVEALDPSTGEARTFETPNMPFFERTFLFHA